MKIKITSFLNEQKILARKKNKNLINKSQKKTLDEILTLDNEVGSSPW